MCHRTVQSLTLTTITLLATIVYHGEAYRNCTYQYTRQPGPTEKCCNLKGYSPLILQCQVTSDKSSFSLHWHYRNSSSLPIIESSTSHYFIDQTKAIYNVTQTAEIHSETELQVTTSQLSITGFNDREVGYYWCSVRRHPDEGTIDAANPSTVLLLTSPYSIEEVQSCQEAVKLHSATGPIRCADIATRIDVIEAQDNTGACSDIHVYYTNSPTDTEIKASNISSTVDTKSEPTNPKADDSMSAEQTERDEGNKATSTAKDSAILGGTLGSFSIVLISIIALLLGMLVAKKFRKNAERNANLATVKKAKPMNQSIPYFISAGAVAATDIDCQPNLAHELSISLNSEYLYIVPD